MKRARLPIVTIALLALVIATMAVPSMAQDDGWRQATNISQSAMALTPTVVTDGQGRFQAFWWDSYASLMTAVYDQGWSAPQVAPIRVTYMDGETAKSRGLGGMPEVVGDGAGRAHAVWLDIPDPNSSVQPLLHSVLSVGSTEWSAPAQVADAASAWALVTAGDGTLHLVYVRPTHTSGAPAGIYHRRSTDGGASWSTPNAVLASFYVRTLSQGSAPLSIAANEASHLYVRWDDPHSGQVTYARSLDGGNTWEPPTSIPSLYRGKRDAELMTDGEQGATLFWQVAEVSAVGSVYRQSYDQASQAWGDPEPLWDGINLRASALQELGASRRALFTPGTPGRLLVAFCGNGQASGADGSCSAPQEVLISTAAGPAAGRWISLRSARGEASTALVAEGQDGDVWALLIPHEALDALAARSTPLWPSAPLSSANESGWTEPINLSHSGATARPALVDDGAGAVQAFWWDDAYGLMSAVRQGEAWTGPFRAPIFRTMLNAEFKEIVQPVGVMPFIAADHAGWAHAWWLEGVGEDEVTGALMHSVLKVGGTIWSTPERIAEDVLAWHMYPDPTGRAHLVYAQAIDAQGAPAGIYYAHWNAAERTWSPATLVYASRHLRLVAAEFLSLTGAADGAGHVLLAWYDPHQEQTVIAGSTDGGATWAEPLPSELLDVRLAALGEERFYLLGRGAREDVMALYQQVSDDGGATWTEPMRVLEGLGGRGTAIALLPAEGVDLLAVAGEGTGGLALAAWDGSSVDGPTDTGWTSIRRMGFTLELGESEQRVFLDSLRLVATDDALVVAGRGHDGEIWTLQQPAGAISWSSAPQDRWAEPTLIAREAVPLARVKVATDESGNIHALWNELDASGWANGTMHYARWDGSRWISPFAALRSPSQGASAPTLAIAGGRVHVVWGGGVDGQVYYASAFLGDAYASEGWSAPRPLLQAGTAPNLGDEPHLVADVAGRLHLVYAVPVNDGRGIRYLRSDDGGQTWTPPQTVFDAAAAGWGRAGSPDLAVGLDGTIHVVWVQASATDAGLPRGIYYAHSIAGGQSWSAPVTLTEGAYGQPRIGLTGAEQVHAVWRGMSGAPTWWHRRSEDGGQSWGATAKLDALGAASTVGLAFDGVANVYAVAVGLDAAGEPALQYVSWNNESLTWSEPDALRTDVSLQSNAEVALGLAAREGRLDVIYRGLTLDEDEVKHTAWFYTHLSVLPQETTPSVSWAATETTQAPQATPTMSIVEGTPVLRPTVSTQAVRQGPPALELGPFSLPLAGVVGIIGAGLLVGAVAIKRRFR